jgi:hypothetical protein
MAWYDESEKYYLRADAECPLTQGDIVLAPTSVIFNDAAESEILGPTDFDQAKRSTLWMAAGDKLPAAPTFSSETRWGAAMIIPHACAMEKEWNEKKIALMKIGIPQADAVEQATADDSLDPYITLAPLGSYEDVDESMHRGIKTNQRLGSFPVCAIETLPESFVDLNRLSTVHYDVISRAHRVASLSNLALAHLHHSLVMHFAYRSYAGLPDLEAAIGCRITDLRISPRAKGRLVVDFILDNGQTLVLEAQGGAEVEGIPLERPPRN